MQNSLPKKKPPEPIEWVPAVPLSVREGFADNKLSGVREEGT